MKLVALHLDHRASLRTQCGQALPLGLAFIASATLLLLVVFNTGEMAPEKSQVANTADAAVYSGLVWQARTLNFQAYTNRAMVANQVSIAQLVSLASWTNYGRISAENLDTAIGWIPIVAPFTQALEGAMTAIEEGVSALANVAIPIIDVFTTALSLAQEAVYNLSYIAMPEVISQVVKENDTRYRATTTYSIAATVQNARGWQGFSRRYSGDDDEMERKTDIINASRDEFSLDRGWDEVDGLPNWVYIIPAFLKFSIVKEGTTRLMQDGDDWEWRGKDGLSLHLKVLTWRGWRNAGEVPMGWGSAYAEGDGACGGNACSGWFRHNRAAEYWADYYDPIELNGYNGVKAYRSLKDLSSDNRDPRIRLHVEVDVANADVRTSQKIGGLGSPLPAVNGMDYGLDPGKFYTEDAYAGDSIASISAGELFFKRPVFSDADKLHVGGETKVEYANLFNPYWDVRLINVSDRHRQIAWGIRSPTLAASAAADVIAVRATDAATDAASDTLQEYTGISEGDLEQYRAIGEQFLDSGSITDGIQRIAEPVIPEGLQAYAP